jgi:hypothetical protein
MAPARNLCSRTLLIRINRDGEPSRYAENPDNWIFSLKMGYIGSLKWKTVCTNGCFMLHIYLRRNKTLIRNSFCRGADKSLARHTSRCILVHGENISFDASLVIYINSTNIPPIMIINNIYETCTGVLISP